MHISSDPDMNIHAIEITDYDVADIDMLEQLIPQEVEVGKVIADGEYYNISGTQALNEMCTIYCIKVILASERT